MTQVVDSVILTLMIRSFLHGMDRSAFIASPFSDRMSILIPASLSNLIFALLSRCFTSSKSEVHQSSLSMCLTC